MINKTNLLLITLLIGGCNTTKPQHPLVITVPPELIKCQSVGKLPPYQTLTDVEVAKTVVRLYKNNVDCKQSIDAIVSYVNRAKRLLNQ